MQELSSGSQSPCTEARNQRQIRFHSSSIFHLAPRQTLCVCRAAVCRERKSSQLCWWIFILILRSGFTSTSGGSLLTDPQTHTEVAPLEVQGDCCGQPPPPHPHLPLNLTAPTLPPQPPPPQSAHPVSCNTIFDCLCPPPASMSLPKPQESGGKKEGRDEGGGGGTLRGGLGGGSVGCRLMLQ